MIARMNSEQARAQDARDSLCRLIAEDGTSVCDDALRLEGSLRDYCPSAKVEIKLLMVANREGVFKALTTHSASNLPIQIVIDQQIKQLQQDHAIERTRAIWAIVTWALALNKITPQEVETITVALGGTAVAVQPPPMPVVVPSPAPAVFIPPPPAAVVVPPPPAAVVVPPPPWVPVPPVQPGSQQQIGRTDPNTLPLATFGHPNTNALPPEIAAQKWNWGAFFFAWIWAIRHGMWWGWLVPPSALIFMLGSVVLFGYTNAGITAVLYGIGAFGFHIYMGVNGNQFGWNYWANRGGVPQYRKVQTGWMIGGFVLGITTIVLTVIGILVVLANYDSPK